MSKVIVERPRRGGTRIRKGRSPRDIEDLPSREKIRPHRGYRKELNENLKPLERFLEQHIGRKWNDVYSEICKNLRLESAVQTRRREPW